jgi:large subunit ribosomal protein L3
VHEIPALPGDDEVAQIAAEQEAGAAASEAAADEAQAADESKDSSS